MKIEKVFMFSAPALFAGTEEELRGLAEAHEEPTIYSFFMRVGVTTTQLQKERAAVEQYLDGVFNPLVDFLRDRLLNYVMKYPTMENVLLFFAGYLNRIIDGRLITRLEMSLTFSTPQYETFYYWDSTEPGDMRLATGAGGWRQPDSSYLLSGNSPLPEIKEEVLEAMLEEFRAAKRMANDGINAWRVEVLRPILEKQVGDSGTVKMGPPPVKQ